jgi:tRNA nucleotidyltransferase (CCA-adding enzyme)
VGEDGKCYYLLLRHVGGHWGFPKGKVEPGEDEQATARRETGEETGIKQFSPVPGFRSVSSYNFRRAGKPVKKQVVYFLANTDNHNFALSREHTACGWYDYPAAKQILTYQESREILRRANEFIDRVKNAWK